MAEDTHCGSMTQLVLALCGRTAQSVMHSINDEKSMQLISVLTSVLEPNSASRTDCPNA
jgi:hypothetical protein